MLSLPRRKALIVVLTLACAPSAFATKDSLQRPTGEIGDLVVAARTVTLNDGRTVEVEAGHVLVPENRRKPDSAPVSIPFYRLRSTAEQPATPIFLLAGGPGSSWIDRFRNDENHREVEFYRTVADVVLFDQRGAGHSLPHMTCDETQRLALDQPLDRKVISATLSDLAARCRDLWIAAGVDLAGYTTRQNAADVIDLARTLGYDTISVVGGSYGSHLALELLRSAPEVIERAVLYGVEGPNHTWDDPTAKLAVLERIAGAVESSEVFREEFSSEGLVATLTGVIERLEREPVTMSVGEGDEQVSVVVGAELIRLLSGFQAGRFSRPNAWAEFILDLRDGDYSLAARAAVALRRMRLQGPMKYSMDCASGISPDRATDIRGASATHIVGNQNLEYEAICPDWPVPDLGPEFREPVVSDLPVLLIQGTWDTSTPIENAREVAATLPNAQLVEVVGGNHGTLYNLYARWAPMHSKLASFLRGEPTVFPATVTLPYPAFDPRD